MYHLKGLASVIAYLSHLSYPEIWLAILASGHVIPVPEGVTFMVLGYLAAVGQGSIVGFLLISIIGALSFDLIMYGLSRAGVAAVAVVSEKAKDKYLKHYQDAGHQKVLAMTVASHFVPGWRFLNPAILAVIEVPFWRVVAYSALGCIAYAPVYVMIGYVFHARITALILAVEGLHRVATLSLVGIGALAIVAWFSLGKRLRK